MTITQTNPSPNQLPVKFSHISYLSEEIHSVNVNPRMRTISLCVMGSPYANFLAIPARLHAGIPICIR